MKKQIAVIGMGRFGRSLATTLCDLGHDVLGVDTDEKKVENVASVITHAVQADATKEATLKDLGITNFDVAVVAIGEATESSVLCTILLKKLGVAYVVARANDDLHGSILEKIGADIVVYPEQEMGARLARGITMFDVADYMSVIQGYGIAKLPVPPYFFNEKLSELGFGQRGKLGVATLLLQSKDEILISPNQSEVIKAGDVLIVAGNDDNLEKLLTEAKKRMEGIVKKSREKEEQAKQ